MEISQFNPFIRYIDKRKYTDEYKEAVKAYDHRLFYVSKGTIRAYVGKETINLKDNEMIILPPAYSYRLEVLEEETEYFIVNFDFIYDRINVEPIPPQSKKLFNAKNIISAATCENFPMHLRCSQSIKDKFKEMYDLYFTKNDLFNELISAVLKEIVVGSIMFTKYDRTPELVKRVVSYIDCNYLSGLTNSQIAEAFSYHPNYVNRIFKKYTGKTIHTYIKELRLRYAQRLLCNTNMDVGEIAEKSGFESYSYFIKYFRITYGLSPLKYRKRNSKRI